MPRRPRAATGGLAYHELNRRVGRLALFEQAADYAAFEKILAQVSVKVETVSGTVFIVPTPSTISPENGS